MDPDHEREPSIREPWINFTSKFHATKEQNAEEKRRLDVTNLGPGRGALWRCQVGGGGARSREDGGGLLLRGRMAGARRHGGRQLHGGERTAYSQWIGLG